MKNSFVLILRFLAQMNIDFKMPLDSKSINLC